jgi:hypothetical protein
MLLDIMDLSDELIYVRDFSEMTSYTQVSLMFLSLGRRTHHFQVS